MTETDYLTPEQVTQVLQDHGQPATFDGDVVQTLEQTATGWTLASMDKWWLLASISAGGGADRPDQVEVWWLNDLGHASDSWAGDTVYWRSHRNAEHLAQLLSERGGPTQVYAVNLGDWNRYGDRIVRGVDNPMSGFRTEATRQFVRALIHARAGGQTL